MKLRLIQGVRSDYFDWKHQLEVIRSTGITMEDIAKLVGIDRRTIGRLYGNSFRKNSNFFKHLGLISIINGIYDSMPDKEKRKAERKLERKQRKKSTINRVVYRPETDKNISAE